MRHLSEKELNNVSGGGIKTWAFIAVGIFVFATGVIDGYLRPLKCN